MLADSLLLRGIAVLRYDKRFAGKSLPADMGTIKEQDLRFETYISDAVGFIRLLQKDKRFSRVYVIGHSEGSLIGMVAAQQTRASGYISIAGAGRNTVDILKTQLQSLPEPLRVVAYHSLDSLRAGKLVSQPPKALYALLRPSLQPYMISWMNYDPATEIKKFRGPVLLIQGRHDIQIAASEVEALKAARPDAKLAFFDAMNHILKDSPEDLASNLRTYTQPDLPLTTGLAKAIADFIK